MALQLLWGYPHLIVGMFEGKLPLALVEQSPTFIASSLLQLRLFNAKSASTRSPSSDVSGEQMRRLVSGGRNAPSSKPPWVRSGGGGGQSHGFPLVQQGLLLPWKNQIFCRMNEDAAMWERVKARGQIHSPDGGCPRYGEKKKGSFRQRRGPVPPRKGR